MEKKIDRRILKTKKAIKSAFIDLLAQKNVNDITITDIAKLADVNRKTFYNNYSGIHEIINEIEDELFERFKTAIKGLDTKSELEGPYNVLIRLTKLLDEDFDYFKKVMNSDLKTNLSEKIISYLKDKLKDVLKRQRCDYTEYENNVVVEYSISGMFQVYNKWLYNGRREPVEKLAMIISNLFFDGVRKHLKY